MLRYENSKLNGWIELNVMHDVTKEKEHVLKSNSLNDLSLQDQCDVIDVRKART